MSAPLPPPPDFLRMALAAQENRRREEQDRLQQMMTIENMRRGAIRQGQDAIAQGLDAKDVFGMLSYRDPLVEANLKAMQSARDKKREQEENKGVAETLLPNVSRLGVEAPETTQFQQGADKLRELLGPEAADKILSGIEIQRTMAPVLGALDQIQAAEKFQQSLQELGAQENLKSGVAIAQNRQTTADRLALEDASGQVAAARNARIESGSETIARALQRSSQDPQGLTNALLQVQQGMTNPALEMPQVLSKANAIWSANQESDAIVDVFARQGYTIPSSLARAVKEGKDASIDEFTGLVSVDPGERGAEMRQARATSMYQLVEMKEIGKRLVNGPMRGMDWKSRISWITSQKAKAAVGEADPMYMEFLKRQEQFVASLARATFTGQMSNQERNFAEGLVQNVWSLAGNKEGTDLSPQANASFNALESSLYAKYRTATPRGVFTDKQLRDAIDASKSQHAEDIRKNVLDVQYPSAPDSGGWQGF